MAIPADTVERQRRASDPRRSAWVSAHAGSGKTHVLTQRVVRLLLDGVPPARILCLTFTKAAAANMAIRVFKTLADWTALDDAALARAIIDMGAPHPGASELAVARKLFARTVETPGGLKIQTIHAFCERLLHLFPFEANVAARFAVLDELVQADLLAAAKRDTLGVAVADDASALGQAVATLAQAITAAQLDDLVAEALAHRALLRDLNRAESQSRIAAALGLGAEETVERVERAMRDDGLPAATWGPIAQQLGADGGKDTAANRLAAAALTAPGAALDAYLAVFLTQKLEARSDSYLPKSLRASHPALCARLDAERDRLVTLVDRRRAAATLDRTAALAAVAGAILDRYEAEKQRRGLLDFEDLIERTLTLLRRAGAAWVLYKLDSGIDHVLVDEAQDTSPAQWEILRAITADFFSGAGQARRPRTFFAVGDEKQSIFSFQGARPAMFDDMRRAFEQDTRRGEAAFEEVPLNLSFRSTGAILETVDRVFKTADHAQGLSAKADGMMAHVPLRQGAPGAVELWPVVGPTPQPEPKDWTLPLNHVDPQSPAVRVARRIAAVIADLTAPGSRETVEDRADGRRRPIRPGDIMILVRSRGVFFDAVIRALKNSSVPVAGADRLQLTEHIAVMDLIAAGRAALLPEDDLTLACVLKSPLIGLDDDDLIALAPQRRGSLAEALAGSAAATHREAAARLASWRRSAATATPFAFFTHLLGAEGGRRAMLERLGPEAGDALDEFVALTLAHEREGAPSLLAFLARLEGQDLSIKRDMEATGDAVRVMTVHAAKGLEAKIVFLPDTCGTPSGVHDPKLFGLPDSAAATALAWSTGSEADPSAVADARAALRQAATEEYNRLLYVALTRAEERLYIAGFHGTRGKAAGCWYDMIAASGLDLDEAPAFWDAAETILRRRDPGLDDPATAPRTDERRPTPTPDWLTRAPPREVTYAPPVKPSTALGAADQLAIGSQGFDLMPRDRARQSAALAGRLTHTLLQHLPEVAPSRRGAAAARFIAARGSGLDAARQAGLVADVLGVLEHPDLAPLFGSGSRAEVGIAGAIPRADGRQIEIAGQLDRIGVTDDSVLIADFKTGRPHAADSVPDAFVTQLALYRDAVRPLYPDKVVRAFLVWTAGPVIVELPSDRLDAAMAAIVA